MYTMLYSYTMLYEYNIIAIVRLLIHVNRFIKVLYLTKKVKTFKFPN